MSLEKEILFSLKRIIKYLEILIDSKRTTSPEIKNGVMEWDGENQKLTELKIKTTFKLEMLLNIEKQVSILVKNTILFAKGLPANNILLWGDRGTGKSSLIYLAFDKIYKKNKISMIEIKNNRLESLSFLMEKLSNYKGKYIIFCDDFSFNHNTKDIAIFKNILDGTLRKTSNVIFYATSNFRHMVKEYDVSLENKILEKEKIDDITALSDRFGIWLSFPTFNKEEYLKIVDCYCSYYKINIPKDVLIKKAMQWRLLRGSGSGREALNFVKSLFNRHMQ